MPVEISKGFDATERAELAHLYWQAFGDKLGKVMGPAPRARRFIAQIMEPSHALVARDAGAILGVVGFKSRQGAFVGAGMRDVCAAYGRFGGLWRSGVLSLLERDVENRNLLMDGICVAGGARGHGVGTRLLHAIFDEARARNLPGVRLDVADSNPRARALYEREGFRLVGEDQLGPLAWVFGFKSSLRMVREV